MREADTIPACFEAETGPFDGGAVEAWFAARREVMLSDAPKGKEVEPPVPLNKLSATVQRRCREYLAEVAAKVRPMNGVKPSTGKIGGRFVE